MVGHLFEDLVEVVTLWCGCGSCDLGRYAVLGRRSEQDSEFAEHALGSCCHSHKEFADVLEYRPRLCRCPHPCHYQHPPDSEHPIAATELSHQLKRSFCGRLGIAVEASAASATSSEAYSGSSDAATFELLSGLLSSSSMPSAALVFVPDDEPQLGIQFGRSCSRSHLGEITSDVAEPAAVVVVQSTIA